MYTTNENDTLEFQLNFKVAKKVRKGFLGLHSKSEDIVILNDGKVIDGLSERRWQTIFNLQCGEGSSRAQWQRFWVLGKLFVKTISWASQHRCYHRSKRLLDVLVRLITKPCDDKWEILSRDVGLHRIFDPAYVLIDSL